MFLGLNNRPPAPVDLKIIQRNYFLDISFRFKVLDLLKAFFNIKTKECLNTSTKMDTSV